MKQPFPRFGPKEIDLLKIRCSLYLNHTVPISDQIKIDDASESRAAAVFIPLCNFQNMPSVIFTLRSTAVGTHKGQVSFPGGHINDGENAIEAAMRETREELGSRLGEFEILAQCQMVPTLTGTIVTPVLGFLMKDFTDFSLFTSNPREVDRVFVRSIDQLMSPGYRTFEKFNRNGRVVNMPVFGANEKEERIWGLTAIILSGVLDNVLDPKTM